MSNLFIVNLSVTDLLSSVLVMGVSLISIAADLHHSDAMWCSLQCAANYCLIIVSMVTLAFISIDRYFAVLHPLHYLSHVTKSRVVVAIVWPWLQGLAFAVPPVLLHWVHYDYWEGVCAINWQHHQQQSVYYVIVACVLCFGVPGFVMIYCYVHIIREARKCQRLIQPTCANMPISSNLKAAIKTITSLLVVVVIFFVCMTPFCITKLLKVVIFNEYIAGYVNLVSSYFEYLASLANPFIYGIFRSEFRQAYRHFCWHMACRMPHMHHINLDESRTNSLIAPLRQSQRQRRPLSDGRDTPSGHSNAPLQSEQAASTPPPPCHHANGVTSNGSNNAVDVELPLTRYNVTVEVHKNRKPDVLRWRPSSCKGRSKTSSVFVVSAPESCV